MPKFQVFGFALVPVELSIEIEAETPAAALTEAQRQFDTTPRAGVITPRSHDESAVHGWQAATAVEITEVP